MDSQRPSEGIYLGYQDDNALDSAVIESMYYFGDYFFRWAINVTTI
jgi:hypothetical protein